MGKGYSGAFVISLCAVFFFIGCLIQQLPVLPAPSSGFSKSDSDKKVSIRRQVTEVHPVIPDAVGAQPPPLGDLDGNPMNRLGAEEQTASQAKTYDSAVEHLLPDPLQPGESGTFFHTSQPFQQLSWYPRMYVFPKFMDDERADHIVKIASDRLGPSTLAYRKNDNPDNSRDVRTSSGTFLSRHQDPAGVLAWVEEKIAALTHLPVANGEPFNVLRYNLGQHYDSHYDVFDPAEYGPQESNRMATVLFYLTDVEEGGETVFPFEGADGMKNKENFNYKSCDLGYRQPLVRVLFVSAPRDSLTVQYKPRKGDALLFWSIHPNGTFDAHSLHGGCPVIKGQKMVMTRWIRDTCHGRCF